MDEDRKYSLEIRMWRWTTETKKRKEKRKERKEKKKKPVPTPRPAREQIGKQKVFVFCPDLASGEVHLEVIKEKKKQKKQSDDLLGWVVLMGKRDGGKKFVGQIEKHSFFFFDNLVGSWDEPEKKRR